MVAERIKLARVEAIELMFKELDLDEKTRCLDDLKKIMDKGLKRAASGNGTLKSPRFTDEELILLMYCYMKYRQEWFKVVVSLQYKKIAISVQDDGPGIPPEHQSRVFDRFYRVDKSRTERAHSGLGLSIAKKVVTDHGGQLIYKAVKPTGSIFCMILPCLHISKQ